MERTVAGAWCILNKHQNNGIHFYKRLPMEQTPSGKIVKATLETNPICGEEDAGLQTFSELLPNHPDTMDQNCEKCVKMLSTDG